MALCSRCGVDIGEAKRCPLCGSVPHGIAEEAPEVNAHANFMDKAAAMQPPSRAKRFVVAELLTVSLGIAGFMVALIDLVTGGGLGWSLYPLASLGFIWLALCPLLFFTGKPAFGIACTALAPFAFLLAMDAINGRVDWFLLLGLPIAASAEMAVALTVLASARAKRKGFNILAYSLIAVSFVCLAVEGSIALWSRGAILFGWSVITATALVSVAAFLLYVHHRLAKDATLKRLFHI